MTIKQALNFAKQSLDSIEAKTLIKHTLKKDNMYITINEDKEITKNEELEFISSLKKIKEGYPLQYITHHQEFMGLDFEVNEDVLIPQPDTEVLVENTIKLVLENFSKNSSDDFQRQNVITNGIRGELKKNKSTTNLKILDLCTGSGAIAIALKKYLPNILVFASDISEKALKIAQKNAKNNNVEVSFIKSNMFENINNKFDLIVSNPPYIKSSEISKLPKQVQNEPKIALDGGKDGLDFYKIIYNEAPKFLNEKGIILLEIGYDQGLAVTNIFKNSKIIKDYAGNDRVIVWFAK